MSQRPNAEDSGFTLVELLVVISILGVLAAVVVFAVSGITDRGETAACAADSRVMRSAEESYFAKNGSYATEAELQSGGLLSAPSANFDVSVSGSSYNLIGVGPCVGATMFDGFEPPAVAAANANSFYTVSAPNSFGAWTMLSGSIDVVATSFWGSTNTMGIAAGNTIDLNGDTYGSMQRTFTGLTSGKTYTLRFKYAANGGSATMRIRVGNLDQTVNVTTPTSSAWRTGSYAFTASGATQTLRFDGSGVSPYQGVALDDINIS